MNIFYILQWMFPQLSMKLWLLLTWNYTVHQLLTSICPLTYMVTSMVPFVQECTKLTKYYLVQVCVWGIFSTKKKKRVSKCLHHNPLDTVCQRSRLYPTTRKEQTHPLQNTSINGACLFVSNIETAQQLALPGTIPQTHTHITTARILTLWIFL